MLLLLNPAVTPGRRDLPLELYETELHVTEGRAAFSFVRANFLVEVTTLLGRAWGDGRAAMGGLQGAGCEGRAAGVRLPRAGPLGWHKLKHQPIEQVLECCGVGHLLLSLSA